MKKTFFKRDWRCLLLIFILCLHFSFVFDTSYISILEIVSYTFNGLKSDSNLDTTLDTTVFEFQTSPSAQIKEMGYEEHDPININGNADFAITIRTLVVNESKAYIQTGAGIVADSIPEREWYETEHKARALLKALEMSGENNHESTSYRQL